MASFKDIQSELFKKHGINEDEFKKRSKSSSSPEQYKGMTEMDSILKKYRVGSSYADPNARKASANAFTANCSLPEMDSA